jgi:hypothetical protein
MAPKEEGGNGLSREQAISSVAKDHKIDDQRKPEITSRQGTLQTLLEHIS